MHICSIALGWPLIYLYGDGKSEFVLIYIKTIKEHRENLKEVHLQILPD